MKEAQDEPKDITEYTSELADESSSLGEIRINHSVVAGIVRHAAMENPAVYSVGGGFVDLLSKKESDRGVRVKEEDNGYIIDIRLVLHYGVELAKTALDVQERVKERIEAMTGKDVRKVDVTIERIEMKDEGDEMESEDDDETTSA